MKSFVGQIWINKIYGLLGLEDLPGRLTWGGQKVPLEWSSSSSI